jgi:hypothetical protein
LMSFTICVSRYRLLCSSFILISQDALTLTDPHIFLCSFLSQVTNIVMAFSGTVQVSLLYIPMGLIWFVNPCFHFCRYTYGFNFHIIFYYIWYP